MMCIIGICVVAIMSAKLLSVHMFKSFCTKHDETLHKNISCLTAAVCGFL